MSWAISVWVGNERVPAFLKWFSLCFHWSVGKLVLVLVLIVLTSGLEILFNRLKIQIYINSYFLCYFSVWMATCGCCGYIQDDFFVTTPSTTFFLRRFILQLWLTFLVTVLIHLYIYSNLDFIFLLITTLHCIAVGKSVEHPPIPQIYPVCAKSQITFTHLFSLFSAFSRALWRTNTPVGLCW